MFMYIFPVISFQYFDVKFSFIYLVPASSILFPELGVVYVMPC